MKRFSRTLPCVLSCILALALLAGCDANKPAATAPETKIGVVNLEKVFAEAKAAKEGVKLLQSLPGSRSSRPRAGTTRRRPRSSAS
jgi:Skp family chaperone for outer membrane proteins